jgi:hypothetical protein
MFGRQQKFGQFKKSNRDLDTVIQKQYQNHDENNNQNKVLTDHT